MVQTLAPDENQWISTTARAGRVGVRYYLQLGPGYQSTDVFNPLFPGPTTCTNDKYTQFGHYFTASTNGFYFEGGGFDQSSNLAPADVIGDWIRRSESTRLVFVHWHTACQATRTARCQRRPDQRSSEDR